MSNARSGNTHYVDSTGILSSEKNVKVVGVIVTTTAASAIVAINDQSGAIGKLQLRVATSGETVHFDFSNSPIIFPNGINVTTLTNAIATVIYNSGGG